MARNEVEGVLAKRHTVGCQCVLFNSGEAMPAIRDRIEGIRNRCRLCLSLNIQRISVIDDRVLIAMALKVALYIIKHDACSAGCVPTASQVGQRGGGLQCGLHKRAAQRSRTARVPARRILKSGGRCRVG